MVFKRLLCELRGLLIVNDGCHLKVHERVPSSKVSIESKHITGLE